MDRPQNPARLGANQAAPSGPRRQFGGCASASGPSRDTLIGSGGSSCTSPKHYIHVIPVHHVPREAASRGAGGGGRGGVSDRSRGQQQRRVVHTEPRAERHGVALRANIEKRIRPACGCPACQEAGQATDRVHPRRRASGPGALGRGSDAGWRAACAPSGCGSWRMPAARQGRRFGLRPAPASPVSTRSSLVTERLPGSNMPPWHCPFWATVECCSGGSTPPFPRGDGVPPPHGVGRPFLCRGRHRLRRRHGRVGLEGPAGPGDRPVLRCLGQRRGLGPAAPGLAVALAGAADLGVLSIKLRSAALFAVSLYRPV